MAHPELDPAHVDKFDLADHDARRLAMWNQVLGRDQTEEAPTFL